MERGVTSIDSFQCKTTDCFLTLAFYIFEICNTFPKFNASLGSHFFISDCIPFDNCDIRSGHKTMSHIPWICYERSFSEFYLSIWNQLVFNQRHRLFVQSPQPYLLIFAWRNQMCFPNILVKKTKWISEFRRTNSQELKRWSTLYVNYFLRHYLMMQHQPTLKRVNWTHEWAYGPYQLLITAACTNTGGKMKGSHPRAADRCPFVPRHS